MVTEQQKILFLNLRGQYNSIKEEIDEALSRVMQSGVFSEGREVQHFEDNFANAHKAAHCVAVGNGTSALNTILMALSIGAEDEVIVPANTCFPTSEAICQVGAKPVFIDCEDEYYNIDPIKILSGITNKTKAIIAVHLYGQSAAIDEIKGIADKHGLFLIEDCAQAHLARYNGTYVGNFGIASAFSFYPTKNLGAFGEAGAVITNDSKLATNIRKLKNHGSCIKNVHDEIGHNYRMDSIQAAVLSVKLKSLNRWTEQRRNNALLYQKHLSDVPDIILPKQHPKAEHVFHLYVIRTSLRDKLQGYLSKFGIETAIHYPIPCHLQNAFSKLGYQVGSLPVSESISKEVLSLPIADHLNAVDIEFISSAIKQFTQIHNGECKPSS